MNALSITQPWAWAIARGGKLLENRDWRPPTWAVGQLLAIHATREVDGLAVESLLSHGYAVPAELPTSAVVAIARLTGCTTRRPPVGHPQRRWFMGRYAWQLAGVLALPRPVPCRGQLSVWQLPPEVEARVREELAVLRGEAS
ncbi:MAG TPA: hypothetical protein VF017_15390 [Thermoanaerobaculia bacterium]|nr:hypothetical protein [Thermoanaerobaculia bacterium]